MNEIGISDELKDLTYQDLVNRLMVLYASLNKREDRKTSEKIVHLIEKLENEELVVAFCGHFSAGKSTMINALLDAEILPSSPIPTSANLVKVKSGDPYARIYLKESGVMEFPYPYDLNQIKKYCLDGESISSVEISHPARMLPVGVALFDTPGIDSTDSAHRVATESAMYLADVVFYVMDYNHVLSEVNFHFIKMIQEQGKNVILIINQIDKHSEAELSFAKYKEGIEEALKTWNIVPDGVFYTSVHKPDLKENQFSLLKEELGKRFESKREIILKSVYKTVLHLIEEHKKLKLEQGQDPETEQILKSIPLEQQPRILEEYQLLYKEWEKQRNIASDFEAQFKKELNQILDNANITPYETRELAKQFLESTQPNFRTGFLFSGKKTAEEKERRHHAYYQDLKEKATAQIEWHIKELLIKLPKSYEIHDEHYYNSIYDFTVSLDPNLLSEHIKRGAQINGDYVLLYTKEVAEAIKQIYRKCALTKLEEVLHLLKSVNQNKLEQLETRLNELKKVKDAIERKESANRDLEQFVQELLDILHGKLDEHTLEMARESLQHLKRNTTHQVVERSVTAQNDELLWKDTDRNKEVLREPKTDKPSVEVSFNLKQRTIQFADYLKEVAAKIKHIQGFEKTANDMIQKGERLEKSRFSVALFGAFSAGKSSFANALIGQKILPVSPNPTTAAINKITAPDEQNPHGTVRVKLKSEDDLLNEIQGSLKVFQRNATDLMNALEQISMLNTHAESRKKVHLSFLQAVAKGLSDMKDRLGTEIVIPLDAYPEYVADETKACFVEHIVLYFSCPITEQGFTVVDTPGADSIHARHTNTAFQFIKNADAIFYITYYNHAFSHADREFLYQLGQLKDAFEMDKMFFIINASDLARTQEELDLVVDHVEKNLAMCGIRFPRIYPLSSQKALAKDDPGFAKFEQDFFRFCNEELIEVALQSAKHDLERVRVRISDLVASAKADETARAEKLRSLTQTKAEAIKIIMNTEATSSEKAILKEIDELLYYVKQRFFLRFPEFFKLVFHPGNLRDEGEGKKAMLRACLEELLGLIRYELSQEMRITTVRIEQFVLRTLKQITRQTEQLIMQHVEHFSFHDRIVPENPSILISEQIIIDEKKFSNILQLYKNQKQFFEDNGRETMLTEMEKNLQEPVNAYIQHFSEQFDQAYESFFKHGLDALRKDMVQQVEEYFEGIESALSLSVDINQLINLQKELYQEWKELVTI